MPRFSHGSALADEAPVVAADGINAANNDAAAANADSNPTRFDFLFPQLQEEDKKGDFLLTGEDTVKNLIKLGQAMDDTAGINALKSNLPAAFTYFGQFVAHDISWEKGTKDIKLDADSELEPWDLDQIRSIQNKRNSSLDLECIYGDAEFPAPLDNHGRLLMGNVALSASRPPHKDDHNDVPRTGHTDNFKTDRAARIGDPRNDENLILSQLHVAFMRAHNQLMEQDSFDTARTKLVQLYQTVVLEDFLRRIILPDVLKALKARPDLFYKQPSESLFVPLEFSAAAFRYGHTMIRTSYELNRNFRDKGSLGLLSLFGIPRKYHNLPESWIIEWEQFLTGGSNVARQISTQLVEPLSLLKDANGQPFTGQTRLAVRDLLRGYVFRLPTGQALARTLGADELTHEMEAVVTGSQWTVLENSGFVERTPLWFYILAEAAHERKKHLAEQVDYLGPVGSAVVAGVLVGLMSKTNGSILEHGNSPLGSTLEDLFRLGGVLPPN